MLFCATPIFFTKNIDKNMNFYYFCNVNLLMLQKIKIMRPDVIKDLEKRIFNVTGTCLGNLRHEKTNQLSIRKI